MATGADNLRIATDFSLRLSALLRQQGVKVGTQQVIACVRAIRLFETLTEENLRSLCRLTLVNRKQDLPELDMAFNLLLQEFLQPRMQGADAAEKREGSPIIVKSHEYAGVDSPSLDEEERFRTAGYSVREVDRMKDFRLLQAREMDDYVAALMKIARRFATLARRKTRRSRRVGRIDLHASLRDSVRSGGELLELRYERKVPTHSRFVVVCDVSGSMEIYAVFLLNFLHHLNRLGRLRTESFVFSTRLQSLTTQFRLRHFPEMLRNVGAHFTGWSGGTKIGLAIQALNETFATSVTSRTTVVILSDGWDTGDIPLLEREMERLHRRARAVLWVNPLKGDPDYEPLAAGMAAARPHLDHFVPGHNIESFEGLAQLLAL